MNYNELISCNLDEFTFMSTEDLTDIDGGLVLIGIAALSGGVAFGYGIRKIVRAIFFKFYAYRF